ncbi:DUF924 family protein [Marinobacter sp. X15-166B]|uniref:DUF924 family protein n=1 Tax=Marinobacter sp. X15-166B TaxID=1897620 RepID=UPI00085C5960|nr:DUF924 family protein [Marinobacter sp. X15-166B]OEY67385.1 hypothetical protein BG841_13690 [Marinobacter sp. X15-166B]
MFGWEDILEYWFGTLDAEGLPDAYHRNRWFRATRGFDREIRRRFLSLILFAAENGLTTWRQEPGGRLAEIILLDQFSRNAYRGTELAFSNDRLARKLCGDAMRLGHDMRLPPVQRAFLYLPLTHSENIEDQELAVECYEQLVASTQGMLRDFLQSFLNSAREHCSVVQEFGRFPHRNDILKRASTPREQNYLANGARRYGQ